MAGQACRHGAGLQEARRLAGVRVVADGAILLRSRVRHLGGGDLLGLLLVADPAGGLDVLLRQHHFAVLGRLMAVVALLVFKRVVQERLHQVRRIGLACVVALDAIGRLKGLAVMGLDDRRVFHVMAVNAQPGGVFGQVVGEFALRGIAGLVNNVAGVTATVERRMTAAALGNMHPDVVTGQAEILRLVTRHRLQQEGRVFRLVGVVALQTIASIGRMDLAGEGGRVLVFVAGEAKGKRGGGDELHPGDVPVHSNFVATQAAARDSRVRLTSLWFCPHGTQCISPSPPSGRGWGAWQPLAIQA